jgi:N-acetylmuramoyl-L-alanine amidase
MGVLALLPSAGAGELEVLFEGNWKVLKTETMKGREYLPLSQVAEVTKGKVLRDGLQVGEARFRLVENQPGAIVGDSTVLLTAPPIKHQGAFWVSIDFLIRALEARYGEGRVYWNKATRVVWVGKERHNLHLLRYHSYPDYTRIVIEAAKPLNFRLQEDEKEYLSLRMEGGLLSPTLSDPVRINDGVVKSVEPVQGKEEAVFRIYRDSSGGFTRSFGLKNPDRIVVDLYRAKGGGPSGPAGQAGPPRAEASSPGAPVPSLNPPPLAIRTIVIDPGHGGRDAGAVGPTGLREKDVVLDIGLRLRRLIQERLGIRTVMTRTEDVFVPLEERTAVANRAKADFFVSIHVNAAPKSKAQGFETYYLSREPSDSEARASAIRENLSVNLEGLKPKEQDTLKAILWDMANTLYMKESSELAEILLEELDKILKVENRGVKSAPFFVLMGAAMPAVLTEVAFISNPEEERRLQDAEYKERIAEALYAGIARFKSRYEQRLGLAPSPTAGRAAVPVGK